MLTRRELLLAVVGTAVLPRALQAGIVTHERLSWESFLEHMQALAANHAAASQGAGSIAEQAAALLLQLDVRSHAFTAAAENAWESGNRFWLWQRLTREDGILGGILNIDNEQEVPLHDHPGATGILRVLTGTVEVWQFDLHSDDAQPANQENVVLRRVSHRVLQPGDIAVLLPDTGNIHALRATTKRCRMLDYFIPPYERARRSWYQPVPHSWTDASEITCRRVPEQDYLNS